MTKKPLDPIHLLLLSLSSTLLFAGCFGSNAGDPSEPPPLVGEWRAVLESPGGELPFTLKVYQDHRDLGALAAVAINGPEEVPFSAVRLEGKDVVLAMDWYDSEITARLKQEGGVLEGEWRKTIPDGDSRLPFRAALAEKGRFLPVKTTGEAPGAQEAVADVTGVWHVEFTDEGADGEETEPAQGEFQQRGDRVTGTFLTPVGDYRYLEGTYDEGVLRLSTFDGAHAFLFSARAQEDGTLVGDFWSRDTYHATWTAHRQQEAEGTDDPAAEGGLPDAWEMVGLTNDEGRFTFSFPDLDGNLVSSTDPFFRGRVVLVNIFGSWCPNCNDEAPLLAEWDRQYRDDGLAIVGLAYEFSGDPARDGIVVRRFAERYGIEYPLLLAGTSDKAEAGETLPDLSAVIAFPTSVFIGRDGKVRRIYTGFSGPGTGRHYGELLAELETTLNGLLDEPGPYEVMEGAAQEGEGAGAP